jgi:hypothetical protein
MSPLSPLLPGTPQDQFNATYYYYTQAEADNNPQSLQFTSRDDVAYRRSEPAINYVEGYEYGSTVPFPPPQVPSHRFKARWVGAIHFQEGMFRFTAVSSGSCILRIDGMVMLSMDSELFDSEGSADGTGKSKGKRYQIQSGFVELGAGEHIVVFEYAHSVEIKPNQSWSRIAYSLSQATARLTWERDESMIKIFTYPLPPMYNRDIQSAYQPFCNTSMFSSEVLIHDALERMDLPYVTTDPFAADFYYVPVYNTCKPLPKPLMGVDPWFGFDNIVSAVTYIKRQYPFWGFNNGRNHIFTVSYDWGACFEYLERKAERRGIHPIIASSIILSTIGHMNSNCFRVDQDIVVPAVVVEDPPTREEKVQPLGGVRKFLAFFQGSINWFDKDPSYR